MYLHTLPYFKLLYHFSFLVYSHSAVVYDKLSTIKLHKKHLQGNRLPCPQQAEEDGVEFQEAQCLPP